MIELKNNEKYIISIIIISHNTKTLLENCINSLLRAKINFDYEIIVVDNNSNDGSVQLIKECYKDIKLIENKKNLGFSAANNVGIKSSRGKYILFLNSDTIVIEGTIESLVDYLDNNPKTSAVGPGLLNEDLSLQRSWYFFPTVTKSLFTILGFKRPILHILKFLKLDKSINFTSYPVLSESQNDTCSFDYLILACLLIRKNVLQKIDCLDENLFFYHEDCDLGYKLKLHGPIAYLINIHIIHIGGSTSGKYILESYYQFYRSLFYIFRKHESIFKYYLLKLAILFSITIRIIMAPFGLHNNIYSIGNYKGNQSKYMRGKFTLKSILLTYLRIIRLTI